MAVTANDPKLPIKLPKSNGMDAPTLLIGIVVLKSGHLGSELPARAPGGILSQRLQDQEGEDGGGAKAAERPDSGGGNRLQIARRTVICAARINAALAMR